MDDELYGITEEELDNFVHMRMGLKYNNPAMISDGLRGLKRFGEDIRQVEREISKIIKANRPVQEEYGEKYREKDEFIGGVMRASNETWAEILKVEPSFLREQESAHNKRSKLEVELEIETAHEAEFGGRLKKYLQEKVLARDTHPKAAPHWKRQFNPDRECESYIVTSQTAQELERAYEACLPFDRLFYERTAEMRKEQEE